MQTLTLILPYLKFLAGAGSGWLASLLFEWLRVRGTPGRGGILDTALYSPRMARYSVWVLSALIALPAAALVAFIEGQDTLQAVDAALAILLGTLFSQIRHAQAALPMEPAQ